MAPCSSLILLMFEKEMRLCLVASWLGGVWNGFLLGRVRGQVVLCRFCGAPDSDGHLFWECPFPPLVEIRENPEFHDLTSVDKGNWPCLCYLMLMVCHLGLLVHLRVLVTLLKLRLGVTLPG